MAEKTKSKHLINLENYFSPANPILQKASQAFHELDQLEYDLGLIDNTETTARKISWWPIVSFIGGFSTAKTEFINRYLNADLHSTSHKFTIYQYTHQDANATLPGTAIDADHRLPFYQISQKINQIQTGEGSKVNAYLELKTVKKETLKGKLFIDTPILKPTSDNPVNQALTQHVLGMSDLVMVFTDFFDATPEFIKDTVDKIIDQQDTNKFIYVIDHSEISLDSAKSKDILSSWKRRLAELGIHTGQFILLTDQSQSSIDSSITEIEQRFANIENDRTYRVLNALERSTREITDIYLPEVENHVTLWKDRVNMSTLIVLGFIITLILFGEITMGLAQLLIDPIIGPVFLLLLVIILTPLHLILGKVHAKFIINTLHKRQQQLNLTENLSGLFEKSITFWRMILPINEPVGKNKKTRNRVEALIEKTKDLVQNLNDQFSHYQSDPMYTPVSTADAFENQ